MSEISTMPRLTVVLPAATRGGAEVWQERVLPADAPLDVDVVALDEGPAAEAWRERGVGVRVLPTGSRPWHLVVASLRLACHVRRRGSDVVLGHGVKAGLVATLAVRLSAGRAAWVRHDDSFEGPLVRWLDRWADGRLRTADHLWRDVREPHDLTLVPPLAGEPSSRDEARRALGLPPVEPGAARVAMAGRLVPYKGVDQAIEALTFAAARDWCLDVYGVPDAAYPGEQERLESLVVGHGLGRRVRFLSPRDDVGRHLGAYDAVAVLTRPEPGGRITRESYSMVASEAAAAGASVIAVPPVSERLGAAAIEVPTGAAAEVAEALATVRARPRHLARGASEPPAGPPAVAAARFSAFVHGVIGRPGADLPGTTPISVVTTVLNDAAVTVTLLDRLLPQLGADDELIVVDGGSSDSTIELLHDRAREDARLTVLVEPGAGISRGRNRGIAAARHETIACTDAGCEPDAGWLEALRSAVQAEPEAGLWTGTYRAAAHDALQDAFAAVGYPSLAETARPHGLSRFYTRFFGLAFDPTMPTGRSMAFTRSAWRAAGGFPEHLQTGEDVLFGQAISATHEPVLVRDAAVTWDQRPTLRATATMYLRYGRGSGLSLDRRLLVRDGIRAAAYLGAAVAVLSGCRGARRAATLGAAAYWSLPSYRTLTVEPARRRWTAVALVPVAAAVRDLSKVVGALDGLRRRGRRSA